MTGESNLDTLLKTMKPKLNIGEFVFCSVKDWDGLRHLGKTTWKNSRTLLDFGKYATFTNSLQIFCSTRFCA